MPTNSINPEDFLNTDDWTFEILEKKISLLANHLFDLILEEDSKALADYFNTFRQLLPSLHEELTFAFTYFPGVPLNDHSVAEAWYNFMISLIDHNYRPNHCIEDYNTYLEQNHPSLYQQLLKKGQIRTS
jgi:hypothetical protein